MFVYYLEDSCFLFACPIDDLYIKRVDISPLDVVGLSRGSAPADGRVLAYGASKQAQVRRHRHDRRQAHQNTRTAAQDRQAQVR